MINVLLINILFFIYIIVFSFLSFGQRSKNIIDFKSYQKQQVELPQQSKSLFEKLHDENNVDKKNMEPKKNRVMIKSPNKNYNEYNKILDRQINELKKLYQISKSQENKAELLLRLAELYVEKSDLIKTIIDQQMAQESNQKNKVPDYSSAHIYNQQAIKLYERFITDFSRDSRVDQAIFFVGYNYFEMKDYEKGIMYFNKLDREHPKSRFIIEARFILAEHHFEKNEFLKAKEYYSEVIQSPYKKLVIFSIYKRAWSNFKLAKYKEAIIDLERIIVLNKKIKSSQDIYLENEAKNDLILFYSEVGDPSKAILYFNNLLGKKESLVALEKLAYFYGDQGNHLAAKKLFEYLISQNPLHPKSFDYQYYIVRIFSTFKDVNIFKNELYKWVTSYGYGSSWYKANENNKELINKSQEIIEKSLRIWILVQHQNFQKTKGELSRKLAHDGYQLYFSYFDHSSWAPEMHFFYGELLYDLNNIEDSFKQYLWVIKNGKNSKYYFSSIMNTLIISEKLLPSEKELQSKLGDSIESIPLSSNVQNYIYYGNFFIKEFPQDKIVPEIKFRIGRLYYLHNQFDSAILFFEDIVRNHSNSRYSEVAVNLLLDSYNLKGDINGLRKSAKEILSISAFSGSNVVKQVQEILIKVDFKKAQNLHAEGKIKESAEIYEKFALDYSQSELAGVALFNAAIGYSKIGLNHLALKNLNQFMLRKDSKSFELRSQAASLLASLYKDLGQIEKSAYFYEKAASLVSQNKQEAADYYLNAAILYEALNEPKKSILNYKTYYEKSSSGEKHMALFHIAKLYQMMDDSNSAVTYYQKFVNNEAISSVKKTEALYHLYLYDQSERSQWKKKFFSEYEKLTPEEKKLASSYLAKIELNRLKSIYDDLWKIKINNPNRLKDQMSWKLEKIEQINKLVAKIINYGSDEEILEALKVLGDANLNMYESLIKSPVPKELNTEELIKEYREKVKTNLADPFLVKSIESYQAVLTRSNQFEVYNEQTLLAQEQLSKISSEYNKISYQSMIWERYLPVWK